MIHHLDNLLRDILISRIPSLTSDTQVQFRPPDEDWRNEVTNLNAIALNIYLADMRENRKLRSNARVNVGVENGQVIQQQAPARVDCHYLISAWSPAQPGPAVEPTQDEHNMLYQVTAVLMHNLQLNPTAFYGEGAPELALLPEAIRDADLPMQILPVEGFFKIAEFWGTMGTNHRWKPAVYIVVTLPVVMALEPVGPEVTHIGVETLPGGVNGTIVAVHQIAGYVMDNTGVTPEPVPAAWVRLERIGGQPMQTAETDSQGRFTFSGIPAGTYQLNWRAAGKPAPAAPRIIEVPAFSGEYNLTFV